MFTLKLTTLTMLIPLGWAVSADTYPQSHKGSVGTLAPLPELACHISQCPDRPLSSRTKLPSLSVTRSTRSEPYTTPPRAIGPSPIPQKPVDRI